MAKLPHISYNGNKNASTVKFTGKETNYVEKEPLNIILEDKNGTRKQVYHKHKANVCMFSTPASYCGGQRRKHIEWSVTGLGGSQNIYAWVQIDECPVCHEPPKGGGSGYFPDGPSINIDGLSPWNQSTTVTCGRQLSSGGTRYTCGFDAN